MAVGAVGPYRAAPSGGVATAVTVMADVAVLVVVPLVAVAVMVAVPADTPVTRPDGIVIARTVATVAVVGGPGYGCADKGSAVLIERRSRELLRGSGSDGSGGRRHADGRQNRRAVARAVAMAATWAEVRLLRLLLPMPPMLLLMAVWIWVALLPFLVEEARGLWQLAQLVAYRAAPSGGVAIAVTVMADVAVLVVVPLVAVAVMVAVPADTPVTRPVEALTVATGLLLEDQDTDAPTKAAPF